jgi:hypothetical protein
MKQWSLLTMLLVVPLMKVVGNSANFLKMNGGADQDKKTSGFLSRIDEENKEAFDILTQIISLNDGWQHVATNGGVSVERRTLPAGRFVDPVDAAKGSKHACVKSIGLIDAPPEAVFRLFLDNSRVKEYNEHCVLVKDVIYCPKSSDKSWSKITWASGE